MTESFEDGNYLVRVRAQVMSRDDSSGGWVPLEGGGLSNVSVRKKPRQSTGTTEGGNTKPKYDYLICGKRISDQLVVLSCTIKKDFEYNKVMPTFHHWKTGDKKFGLTFQTAADARAFDKGVRTAVEELLDGFAESHPHSPLHNYPLKDVGDDDVFMTLNLPQEPKDSRSSSDSSTKPPTTIDYIGREKLDPKQLNLAHGKVCHDDHPGENYSYVQLTAVHEYIYPVVGGDDQHHKFPVHICETDTGTFKKYSAPSPPPPSSSMKSGTLKKKTCRSAQSRCKHCHELYFDEGNRKGSCEYAPDCCRSLINAITCLGCAQCVCYHCAADAEGDFARNPCECNSHEEQESCTKRWMCLAVLSVLVPCLWLYPPLKMCHWCCTRCGVCGGRHAPV